MGGLYKPLPEGERRTYSSHWNDHLKDRVPVDLNSTIFVGLYSSKIFTLLDVDGAVAVISSDSDIGSVDDSGENDYGSGAKAERTEDLDLILLPWNPPFVVVHRFRRIDEICDIWVILVGSEEESEEVLVKTHGESNSVPDRIWGWGTKIRKWAAE